MASTSGRVRVIRVSLIWLEPRDVLNMVVDSGTDIDPKNMDRIFDSFFATQSQGIGMGLSICRSIIEAQEGEMSVSPGAEAAPRFKSRCQLA